MAILEDEEITGMLDELDELLTNEKMGRYHWFFLQVVSLLSAEQQRLHSPSTTAPAKLLSFSEAASDNDIFSVLEPLYKWWNGSRERPRIAAFVHSLARKVEREAKKRGQGMDVRVLQLKHNIPRIESYWQGER